MKIQGTHHYSKDIDTMLNVFGSEAIIVNKLETLGSRNVMVTECELSDDQLILSIEREVPAEIPKPMRKFLGDWNKVRQTEHWKRSSDSSFTCDINIEIEGVPTNIKGSAVLSNQGSGCINDISIETTCGIPLVGKKLADLIANKMKQEMDREYQFLLSNL